MKKYLLAASILTAGALPLWSAQAAPQVVFGKAMSVVSDIVTVREANEPKQREDRQNDRRQDRQNDRRQDRHAALSAGMAGAVVILAREAGEAPRGREKEPKDNRRADITPAGFDASHIILAREATSGGHGKDPR